VRPGGSARRAGQARGGLAALKDIGAVGLRHSGNYRHAWPIGDRARRRRTAMATTALPYPKHVDS
jgi:hypothetical protein